MSIYDNAFDEEPKKTPEKAPQQATAAKAPKKPASSPPKPVAKESSDSDSDGKDADPPRRGRCGCRTCLIGCLGICVVFVLICAVGAYLVLKRAPDWAHDAIIAAVKDSDLDAQAKKEVVAQMDRLLREYKSGNVPNEQLADSLEELGKSPVLVLVIAYTAMEVYIEPSGLSGDEKSDAKLAFQRVARGTFDETIDPEDLEDVLDYISRKDFNGNRQLKNYVSDEDLRELVKECTRIANEADVPTEAYQIDVVAEVTRIVDRALGIMPAEVAEIERVGFPTEEDADSSDDANDGPDAVLTEVATPEEAVPDVVTPAPETTTAATIND
jgi:hypothetical protein